MTDSAQSGLVSAGADVGAVHDPKKGGGPLRGLYNFVLRLAGGNLRVSADCTRLHAIGHD